MKLDLLYEIQPIPELWAQPFPGGQRRSEQQAYDQMFEQVRLADNLGFQTAWFVEHHLREHMSACPAPEAVLGGLALATRNLRLGFGVTLMPPGFGHPIRVAEKVATVDIMSHGRVEWGTGRSTAREQYWFGVPTDERSTDEWREAVEFVVAAWEQETISWDSELIKVDGRRQGPRPHQDPHPPAWMAGVSPSSAELAGRSGMGLLAFSHMASIESTAKTIAAFRQAHAECATPLTRTRNDRAGAFTLVHCTDDMDEAEEYGIWASAEYYFKHATEWFISNVPYMPEARQQAMKETLETLQAGFDIRAAAAEGRLVIGTPDQCLETMLKLADAGVDQLICHVEFGSLPQDRILRGIELLGTKVIPELEKRGHRFDYGSLIGGAR